MAGIVVFHPDPSQLRSLVLGLLHQADSVVLFLNSTIPDELRQELSHHPTLHFIQAKENLGVGVALNFIFLMGLLQGARAFVFFDQDSVPPPGLVHRLSSAWQTLVAAGQNPAVVGALLVAEQGTLNKPPTYRYLSQQRGACRSVAFAPTSGSLISADTLRDVGTFRGDFFIDGIDLEWCFRARSKEYTCWVDTDSPMLHSVGTGIIGGGWIRWRMPKQRPFRMYFALRNTVYGLRLRHIPVSWKLRQLAYMPLQITAFAVHHRLRRAVVRQLLTGIRDGWLGRLGPSKDLAG